MKVKIICMKDNNEVIKEQTLKLDPSSKGKSLPFEINDKTGKPEISLNAENQYSLKWFANLFLKWKKRIVLKDYAKTNSVLEMYIEFNHGSKDVLNWSKPEKSKVSDNSISDIEDIL